MPSALDHTDLVARHSHDLIASNLARLPRLGDTIDADLAGRDHCLGRATRRRKSQQFEKDVQLDEFLVELEGTLGH